MDEEPLGMGARCGSSKDLLSIAAVLFRFDGRASGADVSLVSVGAVTPAHLTSTLRTGDLFLHLIT